MLKMRKECKPVATEKRAVHAVNMEGSIAVTRGVVSPDSSLLLSLREPKEPKCVAWKKLRRPEKNIS